MPQIIRYDRAWIPLYKHNPSWFGWFFRVVPSRQLFMLILGTLTICRKGRIGSFTF